MLDQNLAILRGLPPELQKMIEQILCRAIQQDSLAVLMMPPEFKDDEVLMKMAVRSNPLYTSSSRLVFRATNTSLGWLFKSPKRKYGIPFRKLSRDDPEFMEPRVLANRSFTRVL